MDIAVINQSEDLKGRDGDIAWMIWGWMTQLTRDVMPEWGFQNINMFLAPDPKKLNPGTRQMLLVRDADVADALGYHDCDPHSGLPYIRVFTGPIFANRGTIREGANSVSATGSHELCELFGDPGANLWATDKEGVAHAVELCDAVEQSFYNVSHGTTNVAVSNFIHQQWFRTVPENKSFDHMRVCTKPFQVTNGGYDIYMQGEEVKQTFGREYWDWKKEAKKHPTSRAQKRMRHAHKMLASMRKGA